jgi:hypothetical protein
MQLLEAGEQFGSCRRGHKGRLFRLQVVLLFAQIG